jgi:hypothetical protein
MRLFRIQDLTNESANLWQVTTEILAQLDKQRGQLKEIASETEF